MIEKEKPIAVHTETGRYLSHCTRKRAAQMVSRKKAKWVDRDQLMILITNGYNKKICRDVMKRDQMRCIYCDKQLTRDTVTFDHLFPRSLGGTDLEDNIACACQPCNEEKADRTYYEYLFYLITQIMCIQMHYGRR